VSYTDRYVYSEICCSVRRPDAYFFKAKELASHDSLGAGNWARQDWDGDSTKLSNVQQGHCSTVYIVYDECRSKYTLHKTTDLHPMQNAQPRQTTQDTIKQKRITPPQSKLHPLLKP
jgi:hypothetical protein